MAAVAQIAEHQTLKLRAKGSSLLQNGDCLDEKPMKAKLHNFFFLRYNEHYFLNMFYSNPTQSIFCFWNASYLCLQLLYLLMSQVEVV